ncbi:MAG: hypothetical protein ACRD12_04720 [Acidimicrobiales bacterium]
MVLVIEDNRLGGFGLQERFKGLALAGGRPVSEDHIADVLWGDDQPVRPADQVGVLVSRLWGALGAERIARSGPAYALITRVAGTERAARPGRRRGAGAG